MVLVQVRNTLPASPLPMPHKRLLIEWRRAEGDPRKTHVWGPADGTNPVAHVVVGLAVVHPVRHRAVAQPLLPLLQLAHQHCEAARCRTFVLLTLAGLFARNETRKGRRPASFSPLPSSSGARKVVQHLQRGMPVA